MLLAAILAAIKQDVIVGTNSLIYIYMLLMHPIHVQSNRFVTLKTLTSKVGKNSCEFKMWTLLSSNY